MTRFYVHFYDMSIIPERDGRAITTSELCSFQQYFNHIKTIGERMAVCSGATPTVARITGFKVLLFYFSGCNCPQFDTTRAQLYRGKP